MTATEVSQAPVPSFVIGRDAEGFWAARSADGREGGLFVSCDQAEKFARGLARARGGDVAKAFAKSGEPLSLWRGR